MKQIQLYINDQQVDLFKDESITLTETIQNVRDIGKTFTPYSKSFTIPASKVNNRILKHYYNYDIIDGLDARVKLDARIELNYANFQKGKIKLDGVQMKENRPYSYKVTFFGNTVTLKDKLGDDKLDALDWLQDINISYNSSFISDTLQNGQDITAANGEVYQDALVVPLISVKDRLYYDPLETGNTTGNLAFQNGGGVGGVDWQQLKPGLKVRFILDAIKNQYDLNFTNSFFGNNEDFNNLYLWLHRNKGIITQARNGRDLYQANVDFPFRTWGGFYTSNNGFYFYNITPVPNYGGGSEGANNYYNQSTPPQAPQFYHVRLKFTPEVDNIKYNVRVKKDGNTLYVREELEGEQLIDLGELTANGRYTITLESEEVLSFDPTIMTVFAGDYYGPIARISRTSSETDVTADFNITGANEIPEIKVVDFLAGIFKMFNLIAYVDYDQRIIVKTLDEWYTDSTKTYDITSAVDTTQSSIDSALPYKKITFDFAGKESFFAKNHNALFNYQHGVEDYNANNDNLHGSNYTVKLPFEHHKYEKIYDASTGSSTTVQWGWSVDDNKSTIIGKPLLFYAIKQPTGGTQIQIKTTQTQSTTLTSYYVPSNSLSLDPSVNTSNINFKAEINEYANVIFEDTLFNKYYKKYISDTFNPKRRLTKFKARLPISFLLNYSLNDKVVVFDKQYIINSITTNLATGFSDLELINTPSADLYSPDYQTLYINIDSDDGHIDNQSISIDLGSYSYEDRP